MYSEIISIQEIGDLDLIDIEVDGDHLFYGNGILTHNSNSDVSLTDTSESFGLPATADLMFALITDEELEALNQIVVKQLKNRYDDISKLRKFVIGIDRNHMRFYDADPSAQENLMDGPDDDDRPVFDHSKSGGLPPGDRFKDLF